MPVLQLLKKIRDILARDRDAFFHGVVNMASGKVIDEDDRLVLKEYDQMLAEINILIYSMEPTAAMREAVAATYGVLGENHE